jgi:hypothetical protein
MNSSCCRALLAALAVGAAACSSGSHGGGVPEAACVAVESRTLAWSELSPLGFSADGLLRALGGEHETRLARADGTSTGLELGLQRVASGSVSFQRRERESTAGSPDAGTACGDVVSVPADLAFTTNDGAFRETWRVELIAQDPARAVGHAEIDLQALEGDYAVTELDPAAFDRVVGLLELDLRAMAWAGELSGEGRTSSARAQPFEIGSFR